MEIEFPFEDVTLSKAWKALAIFDGAARAARGYLEQLNIPGRDEEAVAGDAQSISTDMNSGESLDVALSSFLATSRRASSSG
jgi:hypothetical protein